MLRWPLLFALLSLSPIAFCEFERTHIEATFVDWNAQTINGQAPAIELKNPEQLDVGDIDGDGAQEVVTISNTVCCVSAVRTHIGIYERDGAGSLRLAQHLILEGARATGLAIGDVNHDTLADLVIGGRDGTLKVFLQTPQHDLAAPLSISNRIDQQDYVPFRPHIVDFNGDGLLDVVTASIKAPLAGVLEFENRYELSHAFGVHVYLQNGTGQLNTPQSLREFTPTDSTSAEFAVADYDGDTRPDLWFVTNELYPRNSSGTGVPYGKCTLEISRNVGNGQLGLPQSSVLSDVETCGPIVAEDFTANSDSMLVITFFNTTNVGRGTNRIFRRNSPSNNGSPLMDIDGGDGPDLRRIQIGDVSGDGRKDLLTSFRYYGVREKNPFGQFHSVITSTARDSFGATAESRYGKLIDIDQDGINEYVSPVAPLTIFRYLPGPRTDIPQPLPGYLPKVNDDFHDYSIFSSRRSDVFFDVSFFKVDGIPSIENDHEVIPYLWTYDQTRFYYSETGGGLRLHRKRSANGTELRFDRPLEILDNSPTTGESLQAQGIATEHLVNGLQTPFNYQFVSTIEAYEDIQQFDAFDNASGQHYPIPSLKVRTTLTLSGIRNGQPITLVEKRTQWIARSFGFTRWQEETADGAKLFKFDDSTIDSDGDGLDYRFDGCPFLYTKWDSLNTNTVGNGCEFDTDHDLLPTAWELANALDANSGAGIDGGLGDYDGDGISNFREYQKGTDHRDPSSKPPSLPRRMILVGEASGGEGRAVWFTSTDSQPYQGLTKGGSVVLNTTTNASLENYNASHGETHPVWCNIDNDEFQELILGLGRGGQGFVEVKDDAAHGFAHLKWLRPPGSWPYYEANGETFPACGDIDGDGRDELVIGFGAGAGGWYAIMDDAIANYGPLPGNSQSVWLRVQSPEYLQRGDGATHPAVGNLDQDSREEILLGLGNGSELTLYAVDDAAARFTSARVFAGSEKVRLLRGGGSGAAEATWPAICDMNGDGAPELVVGLGAGGYYEARVLDSQLGWAQNAFASRTWAPRIDLPHPVPSFDPAGDIHPSCGDLDGDGLDELVVGHGRSGRYAFELFDTTGGTPPPGDVTKLRDVPYDPNRDGTTWPAIGGDEVIDTDGDGVLDSLDRFPNDPSESIDTDGDGQGNNADIDDDNDGLPDTFEIAHGLDPTKASGNDGANADIDGDGLSNLEEMNAGTNPKVADTDNDALPDGWEVANSLDPNSALGVNDGDGDIDGDDVTNYLELLAGTNPRNASSAPPRLPTPLLAQGRANGGQGKVDMFKTEQASPLATLTTNTANAPSPGTAYLTQGETRPAWCDVDGDGLDELVVGLGPGGQGYVEIRDDSAHGHAHMRWLRAGGPWSYYTTNGETFPACGDLDGDGRDELVIGYGSGAGGWYAIHDDSTRDFAAISGYAGGLWNRVKWDSYNNTNGAVHPAVGNLDEDPRAEIVLGLGRGSAGWMLVLDDASRQFAPLNVGPSGNWLQLPFISYRTSNGLTRPMLCALRGGSREQLVVGLGAGMSDALLILDPERQFQRFDLGANVSPSLGNGVLHLGMEAGESSSQLETRVTCGDIDRDGRDELVAGAFDGTNARQVLFDDARKGFNPMGVLPAQSAIAQHRLLWPAVGGEMPVDSDSDGVYDVLDAFPNDANESRDNDSDGVGDNADTDDDADGLPDTYEVEKGLDPLVGSGAEGGGGDPDGDGLTNTEEHTLGTHPKLGDTDSDLLPDGFEVRYAFNPLVADADGDADNDGASNVEEARGGSDPRDGSSLPAVGPRLALGNGGSGDGGLDVQSAATGGQGERVRLSAHAELSGYIGQGGETRPVWCDVDGDGKDELVLGLGRGGKGLLEVKDDKSTGYAHLRWLRAGSWSYYGTNGESYPACGDVDGDGRDELVVGYGPGSAGWFYVFDDAQANYGAVGKGWYQRVWNGYNQANGELHLAVGNLDGDVRDELVVTGGNGNGGWVQWLDDAVTGFGAMVGVASWTQLPWSSYNGANGTVWPGVCDLNGDNKREVVLGLGSGSGGWLYVMDGATGYKAAAFTGQGGGWIRGSDAGYNALNGTLRPVCGQGDGDLADELYLGVGANGGGKVEVRDDALHGLSVLGIRQGSNATGASAVQGVWPAVSR